MPNDKLTSTNFPHRKRTCTGCGLVMDVTLLLPRRPYRCTSCGTVFRHHPAMADDAGSNYRKPMAALRLIATALVSGALVWIAATYSGLVIEPHHLYQASGATAFLALCGGIFARRQSLDAIGLVGVMLTAAGIGTAACLAMGQVPVSSRGQSIVILMLAWLAIGGTGLAQFFRRLSLPSVGSHGLVRPEAVPEDQK